MCRALEYESLLLPFRLETKETLPSPDADQTISVFRSDLGNRSGSAGGMGEKLRDNPVLEADGKPVEVKIVNERIVPLLRGLAPDGSCNGIKPIISNCSPEELEIFRRAFLDGLPESARVRRNRPTNPAPNRLPEPVFEEVPGYSRKRPVKFGDPTGLFEAMVPEVKYLFNVDSLASCENFVNYQGELSPVELLFEMACVPFAKKGPGFYYVIGWVMLRALCGRQERANSKMCEHAEVRTEIGRCAWLEFPNRILPEGVTIEQSNSLLESVKLQLANSKPHTELWFLYFDDKEDLRVNPMTVPDLKEIIKQFFEWFRHNKSSSCKDFLTAPDTLGQWTDKTALKLKQHREFHVGEVD
ncbi:unnamed protein product [Caenorhabditis sp. 36 PRJEB53466]|nr:unnamed protein product [Caenorhabditis sp. 36 PRJEB53466]